MLSDPRSHSAKTAKHNDLATVRPTSTFDSFQPQNDEQARVAQGLKQLATSIVQQRDRVLTEAAPFSAGKVISLHGGPGRGKSHLLEAFVNSIAAAAPELADKMFFLRYSLTLYGYSVTEGARMFGDAPIVLIDDLYRDKTSATDLCAATDIPNFCRAVFDIYDHRRLVIITSNFPVTSDILPRISKVDTTGRAASRLSELMGKRGDIHLIGEDYRERLAASAQAGDPFALPDPFGEVTLPTRPL